MFSRIFNYLSSEDDQDPQFIQLTRNILLFVIAGNIAIIPLVTGFIGEGSRNIPALIALILTLSFEIISLINVSRGKIRMAKVIVPFGLIVAATVISITTNGLKNIAIISFPLSIMIAAILLGRRSIFITTPIVLLAIIFIAYMDLSGRIIYIPTGLDDALILPILIVATVAILHLLLLRLNETIQRARTSEQIQKEENIELTQLRTSLEERVEQRTHELEIANIANERRTRQFKAVTQVTNVISTIQDLETLLPRITELISEQFNFYHVGIFLFDSKREFAVLRATNSPGGFRMLARGHKLQVGQTGIVGFVTATGQPRIALDVGADAVFFDNPDLPDTHSEVALPLRYSSTVIGALDVQSKESYAFREDDLEALSTLADQVAIAINNAATLEQAKQSLLEAQSALGKTTREAWEVMRPKTVGTGLRLTESAVKPLDTPLEGSHIVRAFKTGRTAISNEAGQPTKVAIPIRLRDRVVGILQINTRTANVLTEDDTDIAEAVAERLSLAIESATLLEAAQQRADYERVTTDISSRIGSSSRFESILQTAAQELSRALGGSDVVVQIEPVAFELSSENKLLM